MTKEERDMMDSISHRSYERGYSDGKAKATVIAILIFAVLIPVTAFLNSCTAEEKGYREGYQTGYENGFDQCYGQMEERAEENGVYIDYSDLEREYFE